MLDAVSLLCDLVAISSVNPMGRPLPVGDPPWGEARLTSHLETLLRTHRIPVVRQPALPGRENLAAYLEGRPAPAERGKLLLFDAHQDTVPVEGMTVAPFSPQVRDGRVYGRGSCDVKGGMAAMIVALVRLSELPANRRPSVLLACTVNEEHGFDGAKAVCQRWRAAQPEWFQRLPDAAVVAEPTGLDVVTAHKGVVRWRCSTRGKAAHSSRPELGDNAIYKMARVVSAIERYQATVAKGLAQHPLCGPATLSVGTIHGGISVNVVPDTCTIEIDRRLPPGEEPEAARQHLIDYLAQKAGLDFAVEHDPPDMSGPPLGDGANGPLAERVLAAARLVGAESKKVGVPYATDAAFFAAAGVPTVVFGPGRLEQAHTVDEWIAIDELLQAAEIYYRLAQSLVP